MMKLLSNFAFTFNLRRYAMASKAADAAATVALNMVTDATAAGAYTRPPFGST
jgi:hypothetical protein